MINRLKIYIESKGISISSFEQKIGASDGMIRKAIGKGTDIQSKWLLKVSENYPDLSLEWLITGNGEMLKSDMSGKTNSNRSAALLIEECHNLIEINSKLSEANLQLSDTISRLSLELVNVKMGKGGLDTAEDAQTARVG